MWGTLIRLGAVLALGLLVTLFGIQNGSRTTQLSVDLGLSAWELRKPVSVVVLMAASAGGGFVLALLWLVPGRMRLASRVRALEREVPEAPVGDPTWR